MPLSSKQVGDWGKHWVAQRLIEIGWNVKFPDQRIRPFQLIAQHKLVGKLSVMVRTQRHNTGAIDLGPIGKFSADFLVIVTGALSPEVHASVYCKDDVRLAPLTRDATVSGHPFARDPNPKKGDGLVHVWTHRRNHPTDESRDAWHLLGSPAP